MTVLLRAKAPARRRETKSLVMIVCYLGAGAGVIIVS